MGKWPHKTITSLIVIPLIFLAVRLALVPVVWPEKPPMDCIHRETGFEGCGFIFDEAHYIPAVRTMRVLGQPVNLEHPPLSKWIISAGIELFGDNPWGWRSLNVFFSALTLLLVGLLAYELSNKRVRLSLAAQVLAFTDITFFNISGFAILDPPALTFMMLALYLYVKGYRLLSGLALGLAMLSKSSMMLVGLSIVFVELAYPVINGKTITDLMESLRRVVRRVITPSIIVFLTGLGIYDALSGAFPTPLHHLDFILRYHAGLVFQDPRGVELPLSWILPPISRQPSAYYVVTVNPPGWHPVAFWGVSSPLWWSIWIIVPLAYVFLKNSRPVENPSLEAILLSWVTATYGSFLLLGYAYHRWMYTFYFLQASLPLAVAAPAILEKNGYNLLLKVLMTVQAIWFVMWFPVKPEWLLNLLLNLGLGEVPWI